MPAPDYSLDIIEVTQENQEWARRLDLDPAFEELLYASGGLKGDACFHVVYSTDGPRSAPTVRGYLVSLSDKDGKESISLYKPVGEEGEGTCPGPVESVRVDRNKAVFYGTSSGMTPTTAMELDTGRVYSTAADDGIADELRELGYHSAGAPTTFADVMSRYGASERYTDQLGAFFGVERGTAMAAYDKESVGFFKRIGHYLDLVKRDDEYRTLQMGTIVGEAGEGVLNGLVTGLIFSQGAIYGLAGAMGIMSKFVPKVTTSLAAPLWGRKVDEARASDNSLEELRSVERAREMGFSCANGTLKVLMEPPVIKAVSAVVPPAAALGTIFAAEQFTLAVKDAGAPKTQVAIREELIQGNPEYQKEGYDKELFQLIGTEETLEYATHVIGAGIGLAVAAAAPEVVFPLSLAALGTWYVGKSLWTCYRHNPDVQFELNAREHLPSEAGIEFDSGYVLDFERVGEKGLEPLADRLRISERPSTGRCVVGVDDVEGDWGVRITPREGTSPELTGDRKLFDKPVLRSLLGNRTLKETWALGDEVFVQRYDRRTALKTQRLEDGSYLIGTEGYLKAYGERERETSEGA